MPITIAPPLLDQPTGPGFFQAWETDLIGPIPQGSSWRVSFRTVAAPESVVYSYTIGTSEHQYQGLLGAAGGHLQVAETFNNIFRDQPASMVVELLNDNFQVIDSGGKNVIWDPISGVHALMPFVSPSFVQGGFTEADRKEQVEIKKAVIAPLPLAGAIGAAAQIALSSLVECPPTNQLVKVDEQLLTGSGTLLRPFGPIPVSAYGFVFRFEIVPPGLSVIDGRSLEFPERMCQFLAIKHDKDGLEYVSDRYAFHHDQERVCWGIPFPIRLEYSILPGVTLRFWWLLMSVAP